MIGLRQRLWNAVDEVAFRTGRAIPVAVFLYHSVHPDATDNFGPWRYAVTPDEFQRQVGRITDRYDVRPLSDIVASCRSGSPPTEPTAAITFDDGFRDNYTEALPLLERYDAPATVFVAAKYLDGPPPYEYRLAAKLRSTSRVDTTAGETRIERDLQTDGDRRDVYEAIRHELKFERGEVRETVLDDIAGDVTAAPRMLTSEELRELAGSPLIDVGAHGYEHVPLTAFDGSALARDVSRSRSALESALDGEVTLFSYPYGDYNETVVGAVRGAGFAGAVTTVPRRLPASELVDARFTLPRTDGAG